MGFMINEFDPSANTRMTPAKEHKVYGKNAVKAVWKARPQDIVRVYVVHELITEFSDMLKWCAQSKRAYHVVSTDDLQKVTEANHHEGICLLVKEKLPQDLSELIFFCKDNPQATLVLLENVQNPHNVGAILRVCAHFGVQGVLFYGDCPRPSGSLYRTSEGGAEHLQMVWLADLGASLRLLKSEGFSIVGTSSHSDKNLLGAELPKRLVFLLGSESEGLSSGIQALADMTVQIPGSGLVESLNVACATTALLCENWRRRQGESVHPRVASTMPPPPPTGGRPQNERPRVQIPSDKRKGQHEGSPRAPQPGNQRPTRDQNANGKKSPPSPIQRRIKPR
jgi:TrmH RNA methyltransferase